MSISISPISKTKLSSETLSLLERISVFALGEKYELSLVLCDNDLSHELNRTYRNKDYPTNILSFPLSETEGEIFIDLEKAAIESSDFDRAFENFILFLFIHGLCHLKGMDHGSRMDKAEEEIRNAFRI